MNPLLWMQPRNSTSAVRSMVTLSAVAAVVAIVFEPIQAGKHDLTRTEILVILLVALVGIGSCVLARYRGTLGLAAWAIAPLLAVATIVTLDLLSRDASIAAQVFLFFPTLYGASQLPRAGAIVMTAASVLGEIVVVVALLDPREAILDIGFVGAALVTTVVLLIQGGERQAALLAKLHRQAAIDPLTGLVTRRVLDEAAQSAITGAASVEGTSLMILDVDDFKSINDRYGHPIGDEVLVQLAELLITTSRRNDVVSRLGGDEIALLLPGCSVDALKRRAEQVVWDVRAHTFTMSTGQEIAVSVSAGLAHAPTQANDLRSLYVAADATLYEAKRAGRGRVGGVAPVDPEPLPTEGPPAS
jgi:diguanylate cyclase (GGDEF)-like protein